MRIDATVAWQMYTTCVVSGIGSGVFQAAVSVYYYLLCYV
jgi:hypothetical protein